MRSGRPTRRLTRHVAIAAGAIVLVLLGLAVATAAFDGSEESAPMRVRIAGVDVSGLSESEVRAAARHRAAELLEPPIVITSPDKPGFGVSVPRTDLGARARIDRAVDAALAPRGTLERTLGRLGLLEWRDVPIEFALDERKVDALVTRATEQLNRAGTDARVERKGGRFQAVAAAEEGYGADPAKLRARIEALPSDPIEVSLGPYPPAVDDADAERAAQLANSVAERGVTVTQGPFGVDLPASLIKRAIRFEPTDGGLAVRLAPGVIGPELRPAFASRERKARNAGFRVTGNTVSVIPARDGVRLDLAAIGAAIVQRPAGVDSVRARYERITPGRTTKEAEALNITTLVSEFTTPYSCCEPRVTNIQRAAAILNDTIIPAGGTFSLNEALGQRTEARGFVAAPQIEGGRLEDSVGGGVSQVATTLYNAAFFAGLDIVTHQPHQFYISRYPEGREATVSWGGPELVFKDDWPAAVLIKVDATDSSITVRMFSRPLGRRVETETGERRGLTEPETREVFNPELAPGARVAVQGAGGSGFTVDYTRKVFRDGDLIKDETYTWTYDPQNAFVEVGPAAEAPSGGTTEGGADQGEGGATTDGAEETPSPDESTTQAEPVP